MHIIFFFTSSFLNWVVKKVLDLKNAEFNIITNDFASYEESNNVDVYFFIRTEVALKRLMTYDDQTIQ